MSLPDVQSQESSLHTMNQTSLIPLLASLLFFIFLLLGLLHFYWMLGGTWAFEVVLPTTIKGNKVLSPSSLDCALVGMALLLFGIFYLYKASYIPLPLPNWVLLLGSWTIPLIFLLRTMGDFKYVGFFKSIHQTGFAFWDTLLFSPLCLFIGVLGVLINLYK